MKRLVPWLVTAMLAAAVPFAAAPASHGAQAPPGHTGLVPEVPRTDTPRVDRADVLDIEVVGDRVYLAGTFTSIRDFDGSDVAQPYLAAYDINSGRLDPGFRPDIDRPVAAVEASPDGSAIYIGGRFNTVDGVRRRKIARLDPATGAVDPGFRANANSRVNAIAVSAGAVYAGGFFRTVNGTDRGRLVALDPLTGAVDPSFDLPVTEGIGTGGTLTVQQLQLTTDEATLLVVHTGRRVDGQPRTAVALVDTATASLRPWQTNLFDDALPTVGGVLRVTNGAVAPDGSYFVVVSGSGGDRPPINDTAMAFPMTGGAGTEPLWVSRHFDSIYAVAISEVAVYVGGHFRWQESATASQPWPGDTFGNYGWGVGLGAAVLGDEVVRRDQIGALDPATGTSLDWNPGANAFEGVKVLELHPRGLFVGHDGSIIGGRSIGRHGFFDFTRVPAPAPIEATITDPFEGATVAAGGTTAFAGQARADGGVRRVRLEIRNLDSRQYLQDDGTSWGGYNLVEAVLVEPGTTETAWSYEGVLPTAGSYRIRARTYGEDGARSVWARTRFEAILIDDLPPDTWITAPPSGLVNATTFLLEGVASDDHGVVRLRIFARNADNGMYLQDDGSMGPAWNTFTAYPDNPGDTFVSWSYELTVPEGTWDVNVSATDDAGQSEIRGSSRRYYVSANNAAPTVTVATPGEGDVITPGSTITIQGTASDDTSVRRVEVELRHNETRQGMAIDGTWGVYRWHTVTPLNLDVPQVDWSVTTPPLPAGSYRLRARAYDEAGVVTPSSARPVINFLAAVPGDALPDTSLDFTGTADVEGLTLTLTGVATDDRGVGEVWVVMRDSISRRYVDAGGAFTSAYTLIPATVAAPGATNSAFSLTIDLDNPGDYNVTALATDSAGQWDPDSGGATARYVVFPDDADPYLDLDSPNDGETVTGFISFAGRAYDDVAVARVEVMVTTAADPGFGLRADGTLGVPEWIDAFVTNPGGTGSNYAYATAPLPPGDYVASARAIDSVGQIQPEPNTARVTVVAG